MNLSLHELYETTLMTDRDYPMGDDADNGGIPKLIISDLHHRIRYLENSLPPRVQSLEGAVEEIRKDFKEMRDEARESNQKNRESLQAFADRMEENTRYHMEALEDLRKNNSTEMRKVVVSSETIGKKISFQSGVLWVAGGILMALFLWGDAISRIISALFGAAL